MHTIAHQANNAAAPLGKSGAAVAEKTEQANRPSGIVATTPTPSTGEFNVWPTPLRAMRCAVERLFDCDPARAFVLHAALAILTGRPAFTQGSARDG